MAAVPQQYRKYRIMQQIQTWETVAAILVQKLQLITVRLLFSRLDVRHCDSSDD